MPACRTFFLAGILIATLLPARLPAQPPTQPPAEGGAVGYDIVYVRQPRFGDDVNTTWPEIFHPGRMDPGADLMLLHPDGSEELLKFPFRVVFKEIMDNAMNSRITANWRQSEAETALAQLTQPLWTGDEKPTQEFIDGVAAQIQTILDLPRP